MTARILIVDDVMPNLKLLEAKLDREYFEVLTAQSGPEALDVIERERPDLVLLDVMMPEMDGLEVCRRIKANPETAFLPVVLVTGLDQPQDRVAGLEAGADEFLTKPVDDVSLYARVRSLVRLKFTVDELRSREAYATLADDECSILNQPIKDARILMLDLTGDDVNVVRSCLEPFGGVDVARTPAEIVQIAPRIAYDCVILPTEVGEVDGLRIASRLRSTRETRLLPIVCVSEANNRDRLNKAMDIGVNDYLLRPIDALELVARVRTQIRRKRFADALRENLHMSIKLATTDSVTGLHNRHYMNSQMKTMWDNARKESRPLSVAILDLDKFKLVNDNYGHTAGDEVLTQFAKRISQSVRGIDLAARYGGEEFVIIMPDTPQEIAGKVGERLRSVISSAPFRISADVGELDITVSVGVAGIDDGDLDPKALFERADEALYQAKHAGRDRVCLAGEVANAVPQAVAG
ncbi:MAG: PleD family two-component system response regulator [Pseudomonadota bacterium]